MNKRVPRSVNHPPETRRHRIRSAYDLSEDAKLMPCLIVSHHVTLGSFARYSRTKGNQQACNDGIEDMFLFRRYCLITLIPCPRNVSHEIVRIEEQVLPGQRACNSSSYEHGNKPLRGTGDEQLVPSSPKVVSLRMRPIWVVNALVEVSEVGQRVRRRHRLSLQRLGAFR
jgi:hypothetical protein